MMNKNCPKCKSPWVPKQSCWECGVYPLDQVETKECLLRQIEHKDAEIERLMRRLSG